MDADPARQEIAMTDKTEKDLEAALKKQPKPDLDDQGDIAADDAGATALAERVTKDAGVQGQDDSEN
jgi:hypothetical protein